VTWLQFALLSAPRSAIAKALVVFVTGATLSWTIAAAFGYVPILNGIIGAAQRRPQAAVIGAPHSPLMLFD
jgi:hypothetical protein